MRSAPGTLGQLSRPGSGGLEPRTIELGVKLGVEEALRGISAKALESFLDEQAFWEELGEQARKVMQPVFRALLTAGAEVGAEEIVQVGQKQIATGLEALIDAEATAFTTQWWNGLEGTTKDRLRSAIRTHVERGIVMEDLLKDVEPIFGEGRAGAIATTETTRLFARGALLSYGAADIKRVMWRTANDPWVEDMCRELEGQTWEIGQHQEPPRHVRCRCWLSPVIEEIVLPEEYRELVSFQAADDWGETFRLR